MGDLEVVSKSYCGLRGVVRRDKCRHGVRRGGIVGLVWVRTLARSSDISVC